MRDYVKKYIVSHFLQKTRSFYTLSNELVKHIRKVIKMLDFIKKHVITIITVILISFICFSMGYTLGWIDCVMHYGLETVIIDD